MQLRLFVDTLQTLQDMPILSQLLRYGQVKLDEQPAYPAWLKQLGLQNAQGQHPLAALLQQQEQQPLKTDEALFVVHPVSLQLQRDTVVLADIVTLAAAEYQTATQLLNDYFAADNLQFVSSDCGQFWYLALPSTDVQTFLPQQAMQQAIQAYQPQGEGAALLKRVTNEAQMLLHEHPMQAMREANGQPPLNGVWISGNGALPSQSQSAQSSNMFDALLGDSQLLQALNAHTGVPLYTDLSALRGKSHQHVAAHITDASTVDWALLAPMLKRWQIRSLAIQVPIQSATLSMTLKPHDYVKCWRKNRTLEQVLQNLMVQ